MGTLNPPETVMENYLSDLPLFSRPAFLRPGKLEDAFWRFHTQNPHVYRLLVRLAREWKRSVGGKLGIKALFERARWESRIVTQGEEYALNNNYTAFYARLIMAQERDLKGIFNLREQKVPSTISNHEN
jgi:hypothetical protein